MSGLGSEDAKLVTLARAARARTGAAEGAAVRDLDGRTYSATTVTLPSLQLSAIQVAVAMAVSSGAAGIEAAAVVTSTVGDRASDGLAPVQDLGSGDTPVYLADPGGAVLRTAVV